MSKNTVKPALTPKRRNRSRRQVENTQFDAFVRRVLRAYPRRVAAGDVEALRSLSVLSTEVDAVTRLAVAGLRKPPTATPGPKSPTGLVSPSRPRTSATANGPAEVPST